MHEALQKRVQTALALAVLDCNAPLAALLDDVAKALSGVRCHPAAPIIWPAPSAQGGGGTGKEAAKSGVVGQLKEIIAPRTGMGAGERVEASGLTAESNEAACGRAVVIPQMAGGQVDYLPDPTGNRRFWVMGRGVDSSGLTAEGNEAGAPSTTPAGGQEGATTAEPGAGFSQAFTQLGRRPA